MSLNPVEWTRAQQLLLEILQTVSPIASGNPSFRSAAGVVFKKNLFIPPQSDSISLSTRFPYAVRLLTKLQSAREEMADLLETLPVPEELPEKEIQRGSEAAKKTPEMKDPSAPLKTDPQSERVESAKKPRMNVEETPAKIEKPSTQKPQLEEKEIPFSQRRDASPKEKMPTPTVSGQAVRLIDQVRDAIRNLSNSGNLINPQPGPLRDALKRLKPMIDALIEAVSQSDMHTPSDGLAPKTQFVVPKSPREHLKIPFPRQEEGTKKEPTMIRSATVQKQSADRISPNKMEPEKVRGESVQKPVPKDHSSSNKMLPPNPMSVPSKPNPQPAFSTPIPYVEVHAAIKNQDADLESKPAEKVSLPAAPFTPELNRSNTSQKKKRKRFWSRNSKEDEEKDQST